MKIAVLSGKGGTGKTLVAVNLASAAKSSIYIDCDVEEPNGHLFFKPQQQKEKEIAIKIPVVDEKLCNGCRHCVDFCKFNALAYINGRVKVFEEICHSCGGCKLFCPQKAITEKEKPIGKVVKGLSDNVMVYTGILNTGEASGIPVIQDLLKRNFNSSDSMVFIDCPPGSACIVMESIKDADFCILVAEPTIFGVHNLNMVHELVTLFNKPHGVVLNKCLGGDNPAEKYCLEKEINILGKIPFDKRLGTINSNGQIAFREDEEYKQLFASLLQKIAKSVKGGAS